ncbi:LacI family DNA-binding transcriptional regulator [Arthrobacter cryoconiti]|uniref:LacI family DNA-binding transcriptional regulator n=1 Tax=Arthrobacter cryoconiti TaxID=748907 RepID=A0ABV8QUX0_9MICC|nr:LacI family DNA-binding transcriptional regulator [Arthrobacter cryoconiti]MCC9069710.1 LacI family transcriptional regulator [Arthrobacter cryoconiti]
MTTNRHVPASAPTISEVAKAAGVGRATAARTLGGYGSVGAETRNKVEAAALRLGYQTNELARSMSTGETKTLGVVVADIGNPFFAGVVRGISDYCENRGYNIVVLSTDENVAKERSAVELLRNKRVDGLIVASAAIKAQSADHISAAVKRGTPVVLVDRAIRGLDFDTVLIDNRDAARLAVAHLISHGHRRIGFVWGPETASPPVSVSELLAAAENALWSDGERLQGYLAALFESGIEFDADLVTTTPKNREDAERGVARMLALPCRPTALFATEADATIGALNAIRRAGLGYPRDISLIGFDDNPWAGVIDPPLTMVSQPMLELGQRAAEQLINRIDGNRAEHSVDVLSTVLIERSSVTGPLNAGE